MTSERYCTRCKAETFGEPGSHLCADIAKRLARRERQVNEVESILYDHFAGYYDINEQDRRDAAYAIVQRLANLGVEND